MSTSLTTQQNNSIQLQKAAQQQAQLKLLDFEKPEIIALVKDTVAKGATDDELKFFLTLCATKRLNPFNREIYFSAAGSSRFIMVGRHGKLTIAQRHPEFIAMNSAVIRENDTFEFDALAQCPTKHISGKNPGKIIGAWAIAKRKNHPDVAIVVWLDEYKKDNPAWNKYSQDLIMYKAEDRVLRNQFHSEFDGLPLENVDEIENYNNQTFTIESSQPKALEQNELPPMSETSDLVNPTSHWDQVITPDQVTRLFTIASNLKVSKTELKSYLIENGYIQESSKEIRQSEYEYICDEVLPNLAKFGVKGQTHLDLEQD